MSITDINSTPSTYAPSLDLKNTPAIFRITAAKLSRLNKGQLTLTLPNGQTASFRGAQPGANADIHIKDWRALRRTLSSGDIGFADAYANDEVDTTDMTSVLLFFSQNFEAAGQLARGKAITRLANAFKHRFLNRNSKTGSKRNILAHYDLGNAFYEAWLDSTMTYSAAMFADEDEPLELAQKRKYRAIAEAARVSPQSRVLEIGCGWGGFAEIVAQDYGADIKAITISDAQHAYAERRLSKITSPSQANIVKTDYRDLEGQFDSIVSIEMFEAVGEEYWATYFNKIRDCLAPGGHAALQVITIDDDLFERYRNRADFIQHHIFPGGMLPSVSKLREQAARSGLRMTNQNLFGKDYARTLRIWDDNFVQAWPHIRSDEFDEQFYRLWRFYLAYCEAGFLSGRIDVGHFTFEHQ